MKPGMPQEILSWRDEILTRDEYVDLVGEWSGYIKKNPESAAAYVQLARAMRYAQMGTADERNELVLKALEIDPDCPEALDAYADTGLHSSSPMVTREEAVKYAERAARRAPEWTYPHFTLWSHLISLERYDEANEHLHALMEKGAFPSPLLDFNYNLLVSAEPGAILFTNGDNDTYPSLALQEVRGVRTDVAIVNLSLLNLPEYAFSVWSRTFGKRGPFTKKELRALYDSWKEKREYKKSGTLYAAKVVQALVEKVRDGDWKGPVYFASTVSEQNLAACDRELEIEGLLWRVTRQGKDRSAGEPAINADRTRTLFQEAFRLESATDLGYSWTPESAIRPLMTNYPAVLTKLAGAGAEKGDLETVRFALEKAIRIMDFHGNTDWLKKTAEYWKELDPDNPAVDPWL
jgi:tetratricopeptide (TPR) repeat protein